MPTEPMPRFYLLHPEVAGGLGSETVLDRSSHPPIVSRLHYEFEGWLGDDLLESFPAFIASARLVSELRARQLSGFEVADVLVSRSEQFNDFYGERDLPQFYWLQLSGQPRIDDLAATPDGLVVSSRCLEAIQQFTADQLEVTEAP